MRARWGGALRSRRHPDRQRPRPGRRLQRDARRSRPARRCLTSSCAGWSAPGARGMVGVAFGLTPDERRLRRAARRVPRPLRGAHDARDAASSTAMLPVLAWLERAGAAVGHRHQQGDALRGAAGRRARPGDARGRAGLRRHRGALQAASRAAARGGAPDRPGAADAAPTSATTCATSRPAGPRHAHRRGRVGLPRRRATRPRPGAPTTSIARPDELPGLIGGA